MIGNGHAMGVATEIGQHLHRTTDESSPGSEASEIGSRTSPLPAAYGVTRHSGGLPTVASAYHRARSGHRHATIGDFTTALAGYRPKRQANPTAPNEERRRSHCVSESASRRGYRISAGLGPDENFRAVISPDCARMGERSVCSPMPEKRNPRFPFPRFAPHGGELAAKCKERTFTRSLSCSVTKI